MIMMNYNSRGSNSLRFRLQRQSFGRRYRMESGVFGWANSSERLERALAEGVRKRSVGVRRVLSGREDG